ncbi:response regulator receiver domain-containing protein [Kribbella antiqua]|uniref:Response regulator receiver domain-containing protein n=1 Tax=Kribbella antiqua TaxID=2512217 RepID=A0A4R2J1Q6_9ACTN|nr:response regulator receiver domain-containing protein [Kribbella antiqua]
MAVGIGAHPEVMTPNTNLATVLPEVPILFLTARDSVEDRVAGLTAGGDDYVTKPFSLEEVVARIRLQLRRTAVLSKGQILDRVWHYNFGGQANIVELYISYLRRKIDAGRPPMIHTLCRAGYVLKPAS